ncbi:retrovirus-related pol polyprotein from transposon TNT 1-94 [Tanacetum coccineum]
MQSIFEMSMMGEMKFFLGVQIHQPRRGIIINQSKYALEILKKHGMEKCDSNGTPMAISPKLDVDLSGTPIDQTKYHSMIGSLMYLTTSRTYLSVDMFCATLSARLPESTQGDADYAYFHDTCNNTSGRIQFLCDKLLADLFKKSLSKERVEYLVGRVGMRCLTPEEELKVLANESA